VASPAYLKSQGEPKTPEALTSHQIILFGATAAAADWRFLKDGSELRVSVTPRFATNSADAAIQYAAVGGGLTRVLAYQAADAVRRGRLKIVLAKFEQPILPVHIVYPTSRLLSAKVRAFIDLVVETADWRFGYPAVIPGRCEASNPESRGSGFASRPGTTRVTSLLLRYHAKRAIGARDHGAIRLDQALREAE